MAGNIYPGSVVDVLVTMMGPGEGTSTAVTTTMLQGLQVIGIGSQTVGGDEEFKDKNPGALAKTGQINFRMITLLVTPKQAELLQLATKFGSVSLAMRNPRDNKPVKQDITRMADMAGNNDRLGTNIAKMIAGALSSMPKPTTKPVVAVAADPFAANPKGPKEPAKADPLWEMLIMRGSSKETRTFPLSEVHEGEATPAPVSDADRAAAAAIIGTAGRGQ
jgi:Flp pilus assembly protein CpaB